jgi:hypothetical protein
LLSLCITLCLSLGLHGGRARKTRIEHEGLKAIVSTEGVNRRQCCLRIERLHGTCGVFRRHKRDRAASKWAPPAWNSQLGKSPALPAVSAWSSRCFAASSASRDAVDFRFAILARSRFSLYRIESTWGHKRTRQASAWRRHDARRMPGRVRGDSFFFRRGFTAYPHRAPMARLLSQTCLCEAEAFASAKSWLSHSCE